MDLGQVRWLKIPLLLGGVPLIVGLSLFLFWLVTRWSWLNLVGLFTLYAGLVSVLAGLVGLGIAILKTMRA
jgi:hypothetical protein